jgi:type III restriction enzyme
MLTEGWDVKNVFQIYPHEKRAFDSKLLISQVLGRGLRRPQGLDRAPVVYVFNHQRWGAEINDFVAEILDQDTTITQQPCRRDAAPHFDVHLLETSEVPQTVVVTPLEVNKRLTSLKLGPQMDAEEQTRFVSATDATRAEVLTTRVVERRYPIDDVLDEVRAKLLAHDKRTSGSLATEYPRNRIEEMVRDALSRVGAEPTVVSQENRQRILNSFGGLRQRTAISAARLQTEPVGLILRNTSGMRNVSARVAALSKDVTLVYDELSAVLSDDAGRAALLKADEMPDPKNLIEVSNAYDFKSPTNVVLLDHQPERRFAQRLLQGKHAKLLRSWIKAPDSGFFEIEYAFQEGGVGRSKRGRFNPDFFMLLAGEDLVAVCEVKADGDDSWRNRGKLLAARLYFSDVNRLLEEEGADRRYVFHMLTPRDYDKYFEALRTGTLPHFTSSLEALLVAKTPG